MVVPVVAIVEGVLNNNLVPADEFGKYVNSWEGRPVPVDHPQVNGVHVSANLPTILESRNIGHFHNVNVDGPKLKGELWIDIEAAERKGFSEIVEAFRNNQMMEVSTAYFADTEPTSGEFNGIEYQGIHRNLRPDHIAILPNDEGACSIADGCGAMRTNKQGVIMTVLQKIRDAFGMPGLALEANEASITDKMEAVRAAVYAMDDDENSFFLVDVFEDQVVYENKGEMFRQGYTIQEDGTAELTGEAEQVRMEKSFVPVGQADEDETPPEPGTNEEGSEMAEKPEANALDAETLTAVNWAKEQYAKRVTSLVNGLVANKRCAFSEDELKAMSVEQLEKLDQSLVGGQPDYSGRGFPLETNADDEEEGLPSAPPVVMAKVKEA